MGEKDGRKETAGRPRTKLLDWWVQKTKNRTYEDLKKLALDGRRWRTWTSDLSKDGKLEKKKTYI